ncbi:hypothetical protein KPH14_013111 [Odynerus spinipes]|uniref:KilA-N domain-containing protein n=1 Tax=Odynerus spinipes TaxID=1348599 RepID=A0AAD9VIF5_9HYME|nr:hypothetical protein KPH14_013111 [Odynerus spinipes]
MVMLNIQECDIDDRYLISKLSSFSVIIDKTNGFFNATRLCQNSTKRLVDYIRSNEFINLHETLANILGTSLQLKTSNSFVADQKPEAGTYFHPVLFLALASWCSHEFYIKTCIIANDFFTRTAERRKMFASNFGVNEEDTYVTTKETIDPASREILYAGFNLKLNRRGFFNATKLCRQKGTRLYNFIRLESYIDFCNYVKNMYKINVVDFSSANLSTRFDSTQGTYFHPILFLKLAAWLSAEFYIKIAQIVILTLNQCDEELKLFEISEGENKQIETTESLPLDKFAKFTNRNLDQENEKSGEYIRERARVIEVETQTEGTEGKRKRSDGSESSGTSLAESDISTLTSPIAGNQVRILRSECKYLRNGLKIIER